jgi:hypothetical protein
MWPYEALNGDGIAWWNCFAMELDMLVLLTCATGLSHKKISLKILLGIHADLLIVIMHWMFKLYYVLSFSCVKYLEQSWMRIQISHFPKSMAVTFSNLIQSGICVYWNLSLLAFISSIVFPSFQSHRLSTKFPLSQTIFFLLPFHPFQIP